MIFRVEKSRIDGFSGPYFVSDYFLFGFRMYRTWSKIPPKANP